MLAILSAAANLTRLVRVGLVSMAGLSACTGAPVAGNERLELVEHLVRAVPPGASLSGVSAPHSGTFVAWGGAGVYVLGAREAVTATALKVSQPVAVRLTRGEGIEIIEAEEQTVVTYGRDGKRLHTRKLSLPIEFTGAVAIEDTCMVGGTDSIRYHVFSMAPDGARRPVQQWAGENRSVGKESPRVPASGAGR